jgi:hypothetical protein
MELIAGSGQCCHLFQPNPAVCSGIMLALKVAESYAAGSARKTSILPAEGGPDVHRPAAEASGDSPGIQGLGIKDMGESSRGNANGCIYSTAVTSPMRPIAIGSTILFH